MKQLHTWTREFLERVHERSGVRGIIYVSPSFWKNRMSDTTWFAENGYDILWIAHWMTNDQPTVPAEYGAKAGTEGSRPGKALDRAGDVVDGVRLRPRRRESERWSSTWLRPSQTNAKSSSSIVDGSCARR